MSPNHKCARAVATILATHAAAAVFRGNAGDEAASASTGLTEVVVTAQRRSENIQDVPITIQALTGETLTAAERPRPSTTSSSTCRT